MKLREQLSQNIGLVVGAGAAFAVIALFFFDQDGLLLYIQQTAGHMGPTDLLP